MGNLNIIYGNGEDTKRKLDVLLEGAIKFYGSNYENLILDMIKNTFFYEVDENYVKKEILESISENKKLITSKFLSHKKISSFYLKKYIVEGKASGVVATPIVKTDYDYHIFAHELFGHALCNRINPIIEIDDKLYERNGVSLTAKKNSYYDLLNEGFMEVIASSIVKQSKHNIKDISSINYHTAKYCATKIFDTIGKDQMLKILVYFKYNLETLYNCGNGRNELKLLDKLLELELRTRNNTTINKFSNTKIEHNLNNFQKRKIRG